MHLLLRIGPYVLSLGDIIFFTHASCWNLQVPQQQNSFDCGLFLLHYVELFLEEVPANFSICKITSSTKFVCKMLSLLLFILPYVFYRLLILLIRHKLSILESTIQ